MSTLKGETTATEAGPEHGLTVGEIDDWREKFQQGAENALPSWPTDEDALKDEQVKKRKQKVSELALNLDILRGATSGCPFAPQTSDE